MAWLTSPAVMPILLLVASNVFMTFAWYGHLKYGQVSLITVVLISWCIALPEYFLAVPANRMGHGIYSTAQLKTIQEVITLSIFVLFSVFYMKEAITWNDLIGFVLIASGAAFIFKAA